MQKHGRGRQPRDASVGGGGGGGGGGGREGGDNSAMHHNILESPSGDPKATIYLCLISSFFRFV